MTELQPKSPEWKERFVVKSNPHIKLERTKSSGDLYSVICELQKGDRKIFVIKPQSGIYGMARTSNEKDRIRL